MRPCRTSKVMLARLLVRLPHLDQDCNVPQGLGSKPASGCRGGLGQEWDRQDVRALFVAETVLELTPTMGLGR